ncbi:hypothetical protein C8F01DRAFT_1115102 [Mycena amicta]|nr:hypothetical protein C8F01DRAFT_1115102 [Mycena amicta]
MRFRVHKSVLSMHSTVFLDIFSLPLPADESLVENCPLVALSDKSDEWTHLLKLMYPQFCYGGRPMYR